MDLVRKCDMRIERAAEKLGDNSAKILDKINERKAGWQSRIDVKMKASEEAGEAGEVDKCQELIAGAEKLRASMNEDLESFAREQSRFEGTQKVCPVSGGASPTVCS